MPTIIAVDTSLSMLRPVTSMGMSCFDTDISDDDILTKKTLALEVINRFMDHIHAHCKLEFVSLVSENDFMIHSTHIPVQ